MKLLYGSLIALAAFIFIDCQDCASQPAEASEGKRSQDTYSNGKRSGQVIKLSRKGWANDHLSYEGHLMQGGGWYKSTDEGNAIVMDSPWSFSILDKDEAEHHLVAQLEKAMGEGRRVTLVYEQVKYRWRSEQRTNTDYHIKAVLVWGENGWVHLDGSPYSEILPDLTPE